MRFTKETVHEPAGRERLHFSSTLVESPPFASARVKQGGYGILEDDFWLWRIPKRGFHVFVLTLSGHGQLTMEDGTHHDLYAGDAFISWSTGQGHYEATAPGELWEMIWITFYDDTPRFLPTCPDYQIIEFQKAETLKQIVKNIFFEEMYHDPHSQEVVQLLEQLFLINLERSMGLHEPVVDRRMRQALVPLWELVAKKIERQWTIAQICREAGYSRSHLTRMCNELYGKSPGQIIKEMKMRQAKVMLCNSTLSVEGVGAAVGYNRLSAFSAAFKEFNGISPREFRQDNHSHAKPDHTGLPV